MMVDLSPKLSIYHNVKSQGHNTLILSTDETAALLHCNQYEFYFVCLLILISYSVIVSIVVNFSVNNINLWPLLYCLCEK